MAPRRDGLSANSAPGGLTLARTTAGGAVLGNRDVLSTPFSVSGFTNRLIQDQQARTVADVLKNDPSVQSVQSRGGSFNQFAIRGFPVGNNNVRLDGLAYSRATVIAVNAPELYDRIEILKGPGTFLTGAATQGGVGGVINLVPKRPLDVPYTSVTGTILEGTSLGTAVDASRRFGERGEFGLRLNGIVENGTRIDDSRAQRGIGAVSFDWRPTADFRVFLDFTYSDLKFDRYQNNISVLPAVPFIPRAPNGRINVSQPYNYFDLESSQGLARVEYDFAPNWTVGAAYLGVGLNEISFSPGTPTIQNTRGDLNISSSLGPSSTFYQSAETYVRGKLFTGPINHEISFAYGMTAFESTSSPLLNTIPTVASNIYAPRYYPRPITASGPRGRSGENFSQGIGVTDIISFWDDRISFLVGMRRTAISVENFNSTTNALTTSIDNAKTTPAFAVMVKPTENTLLYANYVEALEPGGIAPNNTVNRNQSLPPVEGQQMEVGAKVEWNGIVGTLAFFEIERALEITDPVTNRFVQTGRRRHQGMEVSASGEVMEGLRLLGGVTFLDPILVRTADPRDEGNRPPGTPRFQAAFYGELDLPWLLQGLSVNGGVYHSSKQFLDLANRQFIPDWTRLDLGLRYRTRIAEGIDATFRLGVENIADLNYWSSAQNSVLSVGAPRTVRASMQVTW